MLAIYQGELRSRLRLEELLQGAFALQERTVNPLTDISARFRQ